VERYLREAKYWLPPAQRQDILAELAEDIRSQIEDREREIGRPLEEPDLVEILQKRGHPIEVAGKFSPQSHLIGPMFFGIYKFVLKLVLLWVIPPAFVFIVAPIFWVADPAPGPALVKLMIFRMPVAMFAAFGVITCIFALLERQKLPGYVFDPTKLSPMPLHGLDGEAEVSRLTSVTNFISEVFWSAVWLYLIWFQPSFHVQGVTISLTPIWRTLFWAWPLAILSSVALSWVNLLRPQRTPLRLGIRIAINGYGLIVLGILMAARKWIDVSSPTLSQVQVDNAIKGSNIGMGITLGVVAATLLVGIWVEARRLLRAELLGLGGPPRACPTAPSRATQVKL
jgi:hypothetical protein